LVSAHLSGRYKKLGWILVSADLTQPIQIMDYWYRLVSAPLLVSTTVTS
jgi:hypothetical protein